MAYFVLENATRTIAGSLVGRPRLHASTKFDGLCGLYEPVRLLSDHGRWIRTGPPPR